jgi:hypothetical protein
MSFRIAVIAVAGDAFNRKRRILISIQLVRYRARMAGVTGQALGCDRTAEVESGRGLETGRDAPHAALRVKLYRRLKRIVAHATITSHSDVSRTVRGSNRKSRSGQLMNEVARRERNRL